MIDLLLSDGSQAPVGTGYAQPERVCRNSLQGQSG